MKAPDKIYLLSPKEGQIGNIAFEEQILAENFGEQRNIEYIRKDALLEWIEEYRNILSESLKSKHSPVTAGKMYVLIKLLDKLNSM